MTTNQTRPDTPQTQPWQNPDRHTHNGKEHSHKNGRIPHDHATGNQPRPQHINRIIAGITTTVIGYLGLDFPWYNAGGTFYSISQAQGLCNSGLGRIAQAFSTQTAANCSDINVLRVILDLVVLAGFTLAGWGLYGLWRQRHAGRLP